MGQPMTISISIDRILIAVLVVATWGSFLVLHECGVILPWATVLCLPIGMAFTVIAILILVAVARLLPGGEKPGPDDKG